MNTEAGNYVADEDVVQGVAGADVQLVGGGVWHHPIHLHHHPPHLDSPHLHLGTYLNQVSNLVPVMGAACSPL